VEAAHEAARPAATPISADGRQPGAEGCRRARKFRRDNRLDYAPDEILVANGGKQIIFDALMATLNPGDEVMIPRPSWISYADMAKFAGGVPVGVSCPQNNGFKLRAEELEAAITPRTKWLILNFPNNPTGAACSRAEMQAIAEVMLRHPQVWILTDDMYEHLIYDGFEFCTIAEVEPRLRDRVLTVNGASKAYAMTGWRIGYCGGPKRLIKAMANVQGQSTSGACTVAQAAAAAALDGPQDLLAERAAVYRDRRDLVGGDAERRARHRLPQAGRCLLALPNVAGCLGRPRRAGAGSRPTPTSSPPCSPRSGSPSCRAPPMA